MIRAKAWRRRVIGTVLGTVLVFTALAAPAFLTPVYDGPLSDHFDGRRFLNIPADRALSKSLFQILRWQLVREPKPWEQRRDAVFFSPPLRVNENARVTFVNHATILIQANGLNLLTDPLWSDRTSPLPWLGPTRYREPGIRFDDLPPIDVVLISHNHYDHMDMRAIRSLAEAHDPTFIVPLGNARYLRRNGVDKVSELDWWQAKKFGDVEIHAVPAQHWSRRGLYDTNRALWAGYVIMTAIGPVYFAGDTGMGPHFERIGTRLGPPRLALLPIGAYQPRWFMAPQHIDPGEAVTAHLLLGATQSMAIHFGTFQLGDDGQDDPQRDLARALLAAEVPKETFWVPANGESRVFEADERTARIAAR